MLFVPSFKIKTSVILSVMSFFSHFEFAVKLTPRCRRRHQLRHRSVTRTAAAPTVTRLTPRVMKARQWCTLIAKTSSCSLQKWMWRQSRRNRRRHSSSSVTYRHRPLPVWQPKRSTKTGDSRPSPIQSNDPLSFALASWAALPGKTEARRSSASSPSSVRRSWTRLPQRRPLSPLRRRPLQNVTQRLGRKSVRTVTSRFHRWRHITIIIILARNVARRLRAPSRPASWVRTSSTKRLTFWPTFSRSPLSSPRRCRTWQSWCTRDCRRRSSPIS